MLGARFSSQIDEFYTIGEIQNLDVYYISQSCFGLPRQSIRNNSDRLILFKQTLGGFESMYKDIGGYGMRYDEFKGMCCEAWRENITIHVLIWLNIKLKVKIVFSMKARTHWMQMWKWRF